MRLIGGRPARNRRPTRALRPRDSAVVDGSDRGASVTSFPACARPLLPLPWLELGEARAAHATVRLAARQHLHEAMRLATTGPTRPALTSMRRPPIPARPKRPAAGVSGISTTRNLHRQTKVGHRTRHTTNVSIRSEWERATVRPLPRPAGRPIPVRGVRRGRSARPSGSGTQPTSRGRPALRVISEPALGTLNGDEGFSRAR